MGCDPPTTMAVSPLCGAHGRPHPAPKPMQRGWYLTLFLHKRPQTGLGLHGREGFALSPAGTLDALSPNRWLWLWGCFGEAKRRLQRSRGTASPLGMSLQLVVCALCCLQDLSPYGFWVICSFYLPPHCLSWRMGQRFVPWVHHPTVHGAGMLAASWGEKKQREASEGTAVSSTTQPRVSPGPSTHARLPMGSMGSVAASCSGAAFPWRASCHLSLFEQDSKLEGAPREVEVRVCSQSPNQSPRDTSGVPNSWDTAVRSVGVLAAGYPVPVSPLRRGTCCGGGCSCCSIPFLSRLWSLLPLLWDRERSHGHGETGGQTSLVTQLDHGVCVY